MLRNISSSWRDTPPPNSIQRQWFLGVCMHAAHVCARGSQDLCVHLVSCYFFLVFVVFLIFRTMFLMTVQD